MASAEEKVLSPSYIGDGKATTRVERRSLSGMICKAGDELGAQDAAQLPQKRV
jgi:hypothetical protein